MTEQRRYDAIFFDLYGTLVDIQTDECIPKPWIELLRFLQTQGSQSTGVPQLRSSFKDLLARQTSERRYFEPDILQVYRQLLCGSGSVANAETITQAAWIFRQASTTSLRLHPGVKELLKRLKSAGLGVALVGNAQCAYTLPELKVLGIEHSFDRILLSSEQGVAKPCPDIFLNALQLTQVSADRALMVGNDLECDIRASMAVGIGAVYLHTAISPSQDPPHPCEPALVVDTNADGPDYHQLADFIMTPSYKVE